MIDKIWCARKASTVEKYCQALRKFFLYCSLNEIKLILPLESLTVANYLIYLSKSNGSKGASNNALAGLKWLHSFIPGLNPSNNPLNDDFIQRISQSENRSLAKLKDRKKPLSDDIIKGILKKYLSLKDPSLHQMRDSLVPCLAYALLLRHDEISHINCSHITLSDEGLKFFIPSSKTDVYRQGKFVFLAKDNHDLYDLFFQYLKKSNLNLKMNHFLICPIIYDPRRKSFSLKNAKLSYAVFRDIVKDAVSALGFDPDEYGIHSCHSGGATA